MKARIQLKTEILIAEIKTKNDIHIDTDEESLSNDLRNLNDQIKQVNDQYQIKLDKWFNSKELEKNEVLETINQMKVKLQTWKSLINPGKLMNDQDKNELNSYDTNILAKTIHYIIHSDIKFEYIQGNSNFGLGYIFETDQLEVNESNSLSINGIINHSQCFYHDHCFDHNQFSSGILSNGNYFFKKYTEISTDLDSTQLLIFDQNLRKITHQKVFENIKANSIYSHGNKIVFAGWSPSIHFNGECQFIIVLDEFLNILAKTQLTYQIKLVNLDKSNISCFNKEGKLIAFDWFLNKLDTNFEFQMKNYNAPFYMPRMYIQKRMFILQFEHIQNRYFVRNSFRNQIYVFDKLGKLLKIIKLSRQLKFIFDSSDNLIILQNNRTLHFHDLNGNLVKKRNLINIENKPVFDFNIDSNGKLTFLY